MGHECDKCIYVANRESIIVPLKVIKNASSSPIFINFFTMPRWVGHASFYAFVCHCGFLSVDYPHGYTGPGYLFLTCQNCQCNLVLDSLEHTEIYKRENTEPPLLWPGSLFARIWMLIKLRRQRKKYGKN